MRLAGKAWLPRTAIYLAALCVGVGLAQITAEPPLELALRAEQPPRKPAAVHARAAAAPPASAEPVVDAEEAALAASTAVAPLPPAHAPAPGPELAASARSTGAAFRDGMIITGSTPHRLILFTFDDGPDTVTTPLLLDRLDDVGIKAVFFLIASRIAGTTPIERRQAVIAREIVRRGHVVGGHTLDHVQLPLLDDEAATFQLTRSEEIFDQVFGSRPFIIRPPFGAHSQRIDQRLAARRYTSVLWNLGAGDFQVRTADEVFQLWLKVYERRERENGDRGGIVLLHDTYAWSVDAFQRIVSHLMERNCELLERDEELFDIVDDLSFFYVPRGDAPAETEAPRAEIPKELLAERQRVLRERTARRCKSLARAW